jgi:hypothetical protein
MSRGVRRFRVSLSLPGRSVLNVKQILRQVPHILPGRCAAKIQAREVAKAEVICGHSTNNRDNDNESFHD